MAATLLIADDSVTVQRVIELTFADEDMAVVAVSDGNQAIACLEATPPDIVLADVGMPGRDGYDVAAFVRSHPALAHIPVLLLAGASEPVDEVRAAEAGCAGVLVKPFEPQMVIARVRGLLDRPAEPGAQSQPLAATVAPDAPLPPMPAPRTSASVDDYFQELDDAFASINAGVDEPRPRVSPVVPARSPVAPGRTEGPATPVPDGARPPLSMADAFGALLRVEQGEPPPMLPDTWSPVVTEDLVDQVARRVAADIGDRVVRELAPEIVTRIAERLVREEIAKLKADAGG